MIKNVYALLLCFASSSALAQDAAAVDKAPVVTNAAPVAANAAASKEEFKPPPGFVTKKRGALVLYCVKDATVGTRFKTERCYNEEQVHEYLAAQEENKRNVDRIRSTCGGGSACATN